MSQNVLCSREHGWFELRGHSNADLCYPTEQILVKYIKSMRHAIICEWEMWGLDHSSLWCSSHYWIHLSVPVSHHLSVWLVKYDEIMNLPQETIPLWIRKHSWWAQLSSYKHMDTINITKYAWYKFTPSHKSIVVLWDASNSFLLDFTASSFRLTSCPVWQKKTKTEAKQSQLGHSKIEND